MQHQTSCPSQLPEGSAPVGEALQSFIQNSFDKKLTLQQKANRAWFSANGKFEQKHTCGVFLKQLDDLRKAPVLYVYLDNNAIMQDFTTNKDIYLIRLHHAGFELSDIQFKLSKTKKKQSDGVGPKADGSVDTQAATSSNTEGTVPGFSQQAEKKEPPQELSSLEAMEDFLGETEVKRAQQMAAAVPAELKDAVYRAMIASLARQRIHTS